MLELLARRAAGAEPGFADKQIRWALAFDARGRFLDVIELGDAGVRGNRGRAFPGCPEFPRQYKQRGGKSEFLWDTLSAIARFDDNPDDTKLCEKQASFAALLGAAAAVLPEVGPVARQLADEAQLRQLRDRLTAARAKPNDKATLQVDGRFPLESDRWHGWWRDQYRASLSQPAPRARRPASRMVCFVTGQPVEPLLAHPKIEGLAGVGGQGMGDVLVGCDKDAFQSYFLEQSANAAVSEEAATRYRAALNDLIRHSSRKLAGALVVHWFSGTVPATDDPLPWLEDGAEEAEAGARLKADKLLRAVSEGTRPDLSGNRYFALTLSGMSGRVMVRDWMDGPFAELVDNVRAWFDDLAIVARDGGGLAHDPKFLAVAGATVRDLKDLPPPFVSKLWRAAVRREPIPRSALAQALGRFKVDVIDKDKKFNHARMGLMKAYLRRSSRKDGEEMKEYLNEEHPSPAYHCGRLMAVLAKLQQAALPGVGAGLVQRYYAAASATPALVLGRLVRGAQFHLNKLEPGLAYWYEQRLGGVVARLGDRVPATLSLEEQSLFALGYYQQWIDLRPKKSVEPKEA